MCHERFEKFKFYLLILSVITSVTQVGILWSYQLHGFPTNFLPSFFNKKILEYPINIKDYFKPYKIIVSEGFDQSHWILNKTNQEFGLLWNDIKWYLPDIIKNAHFVTCRDFDEDYWGNLVVKKAIIFEFKTLIDNEFLGSFLGISVPSKSEQIGVYKILVLPSEDINNNLIIFIYDKQKVFKYVCNINPKGLSKNEYDDIIDKLGENTKLRSYHVVKETIPDKNKELFKIRSDIPVLISENKYEKLYNISFVANNKPDLTKFANNILGNDNEEYDLGIDIYGTMVFKSLNEVYRIYKNSVFEYKYLYTIDEQNNLSESLAFEKALEFITSKKKLVSGVEIFLTGIKKNVENNSINFTFDYSVNEIPVLFNNYRVNSKSEVFLNNAITINADNTRVISCYWIFKDFIVDKKPRVYSIGFTDLLEDTFKYYTNLKRKDFSIEDIEMTYGVTDNSNCELSPVWSVKDKNGGYYFVPMRKKEGE